jgi:predicted ArsR family transcriptional regulator
VETVPAHAVPSSAPADDGRTRDRVTGLLLEHGPQTATELAALLGISPAAVRRHLDGLVAAGRVAERVAQVRSRDRVAAAARPAASP